MREKLENLPEKERKLIPQFVEAVRTCHGTALRSLVLYGSAASGDYRPGHSDLNFLAIIEPLTTERLRAAAACEKAWSARLPINVMYASQDFVRDSADVFPIEFLDMARRRITLFGDDPFEGMKITGENLRLQIEHELRGKLVRLRQSYVRDVMSRAPEKAITALAVNSLTSFLTLFGAMLHMKGAVVPGTQAEIIGLAAREFGLDAEALRRVLEAKSHPRSVHAREAHEMFASYMTQIERAVDAVNDLPNPRGR